MDEFEQAAEDVHMDEDTFHKLAVLKEWKDRSEYPERKYKHLFGFKTWKPEHCIGTTHYNKSSDFDSVHNLFHQIEDELEKAERDYSTGGLGFFCNIERFGIPYGTDPTQILEFYARISNATEPFVVWHANQEHHPTNLYEMDMGDTENEVIYRIECRDGKAELYEVEFESVGEEKLESVNEAEGDSSD